MLINAQLLAEGWNSPRATVCMHLAPTASRRVYQQRIGRIMRIHPRKEAGVVVDFIDPAATHNDRTITLHTLLDADFYRPGARVTPAPRRRMQRRARRKLSPASLARSGHARIPRRRLAVIGREWQRVDPSRLADDEAGAVGAHRRTPASLRRAAAVRGEARTREPRVPRGLPHELRCRESRTAACASQALGDRVATSIDRASFDDLVTIVTSSPTWEKDRVQGVRVLLRAAAEGKVEAPEEIVARWTWRLARATRKLQDRRASAELPDAKRLLGALANSRGHRHEENAARLVNVALEQPPQVAAALLASAEGYTPTAQQLIEAARARIGTIEEVAQALAENLPAPKNPAGKSRRRRRRKKRAGGAEVAHGATEPAADGAQNGAAADVETPPEPAAASESVEV